MFRVLVTDALSPAGLKILQDSPGIEIDDRGGKKMTPEELRRAILKRWNLKRCQESFPD